MRCAGRHPLMTVLWQLGMSAVRVAMSVSQNVLDCRVLVVWHVRLRAFGCRHRRGSLRCVDLFCERALNHWCPCCTLPAPQPAVSFRHCQSIARRGAPVRRGSATSCGRVDRKQLLSSSKALGCFLDVPARLARVRRSDHLFHRGNRTVLGFPGCLRQYQ